MSASRQIITKEKLYTACQLAQGALFSQLLHTLIRKRILSTGEAKQLLKDAALSFAKPHATETEVMAVGGIVAIIDRLAGSVAGD